MLLLVLAPAAIEMTVVMEEITFTAGRAFGEHHFDNGGNVEAAGGRAEYGSGFNFLKTGYGVTTSSGSYVLSTANSGRYGVSGSISMTSGTTTLGNVWGIGIFIWDCPSRQRWKYLFEDWIR